LALNWNRNLISVGSRGRDDDGAKEVFRCHDASGSPGIVQPRGSRGNRH